MIDGAKTYGAAKAYHDSKLCNVLFAREARRRWGETMTIRSFVRAMAPSNSEIPRRYRMRTLISGSGQMAADSNSRPLMANDDH